MKKKIVALSFVGAAVLGGLAIAGASDAHAWRVSDTAHAVNTGYGANIDNSAFNNADSSYPKYAATSFSWAQ